MSYRQTKKSCLCLCIVNTLWKLDKTSSTYSFSPQCLVDHHTEQEVEYFSLYPLQKCRIKLSLREKWPNCRLKPNRSVFGFQEAGSSGSGSYWSGSGSGCLAFRQGFIHSKDLDRVPDQATILKRICIRPYWSNKEILVYILDGNPKHVAQIWIKIGLF